MRRPSPLLAEAMAYVFIAILAAAVLAHAAQTPIPSDFQTTSQGN